jgi:hypothetical protein
LRLRIDRDLRSGRRLFVEERRYVEDRFGYVRGGQLIGGGGETAGGGVWID